MLKKGTLEPSRVFAYFEEISKIPHGSGNTDRISDWLCEFAQREGLFYLKDTANNVIIKKNGTEGYENSCPIILQGHLDMVCVKAPGEKKDMENEGLELEFDGEFLFAKNTSLGADNGIAVAMILALLESKDIPHPPLEAVITSDEEIGLIGATALEVSVLDAKTMINLDSETEGVFTVGCAGGNTTNCYVAVERENFEGEFLSVKISGLKGGHSGIEIDKNRANATVLVGRLLDYARRETEFRIVSLNGGQKENAIPKEAVATVLVKDKENFKSLCKQVEETFKNEYRATDDISVTLTSEGEGIATTKKSTNDIISFIINAPSGVIKMSSEIDGMVETSLNLGVFRTCEKEFFASFCIRSSVESEKEALTSEIKKITELIAGKTEVEGNYPGWEYKSKSYIRELMTDVFYDMYGYNPKIEAIHAGLECGIFSGKIKDLDCISIGPAMFDVHTFSEKLSAKSTKRVWDMLLEVLRRLK